MTELVLTKIVLPIIALLIVFFFEANTTRRVIGSSEAGAAISSLAPESRPLNRVTTQTCPNEPETTHVSRSLSTPPLTEVGHLTLTTGENDIRAAVIDTANGFAYFGTYNPAFVVKVRLSDFARVGALNLTVKNYGITAAAIDSLNGFAYFGMSCIWLGSDSCNSLPAFVVKIRLSRTKTPSPSRA